MVVRDSRVKITTISVCLVLLVSDVTAVPHWSHWWWRIGYTVALFSLNAWYWFGQIRCLSVFGISLASVSFVRAGVFAVDGGRWSGVALNLIVAMSAIGFPTIRRIEEVR